MITLIVAILALAVPVWIDHQKEKNITQTMYYVPVSNNDIDLQKINTANCWTGSATVWRRDAFRCMHENFIYDPCFEVPFNSELISCPLTPYTGDVYFIAETDTVEGRHNNFEEVPPYPWFIKLVDNTECHMISGATNLIANNRMDYSCNKKETSWLLLPIEINNKGISNINCWNGKQIKKCDIKELWY